MLAADAEGTAVCGGMRGNVEDVLCATHGDCLLKTEPPDIRVWCQFGIVLGKSVGLQARRVQVQPGLE